jgi:tetratricopeptide (TPR) repeat protein
MEIVLEHSRAALQAKKICAGCGVAVYCNKECAKADWKRHKPECEGFKRLQSRSIHELSADDMYNKGVALDNTHDYGKANECYREALQKDPTFLIAAANLAANLRKHGDNTEALSVLSAGLRAVEPFLVDGKPKCSDGVPASLSLAHVSAARTTLATALMDQGALPDRSTPTSSTHMLWHTMAIGPEYVCAVTDQCMCRPTPAG